ncbi:hypothetical protein DIU36_21165, partial [Mucilaginibacter rubeus]
MADFNMNDITRLLQKANELGFKISFQDNELMIRLHKHMEADESFLTELRCQKENLIEYFKKYQIQMGDAVQVNGYRPAITAGDRNGRVPLSFSQERLWFIDRLGGSVQYHASGAIRLRGEVTAVGLEHALGSIVDRHEVLRTVLYEEDGRAYQRVLPPGGWRLRSGNWEGVDDLQSGIMALVQAPFELSSDHMLRADLLRIGDNEHLLVITMHHIASDAWSLPLIIRELTELYAAYVEGRQHSLLPLKLQYADYSLWQREYLQGEVLAGKLNYWRDRLSGVSRLNLPLDYVRPLSAGISGGEVGTLLDSGIYNQLLAYCRREGVTLYMALLGVFNVLLHRYSGQQDICIGSSIAGRQYQEIEDLVGFFVNTLALRNHVDPSKHFRELLQQVKQTTLDAYEHQDVPFEKVVEAVGGERDPGRNPIFQVMLVLENVPDAEKLQLGDLQLSEEPTGLISSKFDITLSISESSRGLRLNITYRTDLYRAETIRRMLGHYEQLITGILSDGDCTIGDLDMLGESERYELLESFNATGVRYAEEQETVIEHFRTQAL